jgi:hypothetical protein
MYVLFKLVFDVLFVCIQFNSCLTVLDLRNDKINVMGGTMLGQALMVNRGMHVVDKRFICNFISDNMIFMLFERVKSTASG